MAFRLITENSAVLRYVNHSEIGPRPYRIAKCSRKGIVESGKHLDKAKELSEKNESVSRPQSKGCSEDAYL